MKSQQNAILLSDGTIFFPEKGKNKSKFQIVNLCNGGIKDFVEL